jgi:wobble nucleotide-excising tRNase
MGQCRSAPRTLYIGFRKAKQKKTWDSASLGAKTLREIMLKKEKTPDRASLSKEALKNRKEDFRSEVLKNRKKKDFRSKVLKNFKGVRP